MRNYRRQCWLSILCLSLLTYSVLADFDFSRTSHRWENQRERNSDSYRDSADSSTEYFPRPHHLPHHHRRPLYRDHPGSHTKFGSVHWSESPDFQNQRGPSYRHTESDEYGGQRNINDIVKTGRHTLVGNSLKKQRLVDGMKKDERYSGKSTPLIDMDTDLFRSNKDQSFRKSHLATQKSVAENKHHGLGFPEDHSALHELPPSRDRSRLPKGIENKLQTRDSGSARLSRLLLTKEKTSALVSSQRHKDENRWTTLSQEGQLDSSTKTHKAQFGMSSSSEQSSATNDEPLLKAKGLILDEDNNDYPTHLERFRSLAQESRPLDSESRESISPPHGFSNSKGDGERGLSGGSTIQFQSGSFNKDESNKHLELGAEQDYPLFGTGGEKSTHSLKQQENKSKPWMNFRLFLDDDGKVKLEMSPSSGSMQKEQPKEREPVSLANGNMRGQLPAGGGSHAFGTNVSPHNEAKHNDFHRLGPLSSEVGEIGMPDRRLANSIMSHVLHSPFEQPRHFEFTQHHAPPQPIPVAEGQSKWGQPTLLSGKTIPTNIEILESAAIPLSFDVDDMMTSGCTALRCPKACPGDLRKLSSTTGCPTCDCCPTTVCALNCAFGYEADVDGCPLCKCLLH
ncbi:hypothetical protein FGIG_02697 [Fasciola gigantica]|uniref:Antistasin-like domain-containing protein n=1 Tax=Fasciola gigantica TaxID=46835 RepID=A0A504YLK3_FASGI|nr:hypothetical protein FGIG_02697 [Fasciola gigantica]